MERAQKEALVASLHDTFSESAVVVVTHYIGMSVAELTDLRNKMRASGAGFKVTQNRLTKRALQGTDAQAIEDMFSGPTAIGFSADPVAAPKVLVDFAKANEKLQILGGSLGTQVLDQSGIKALAELPSLDELRGKILGMIQTPATRIAAVTAAPAGQLARVFNAYAQANEAA